MPLGPQLEALWSHPKLLAAGIVALAILAQALHEKRKRRSEGRAPMVSHLIPWVGSALEVGGDPDAFFERAQWVLKYQLTCDCRLTYSQEEVWKYVRHEGIWESRHVRGVSIGVFTPSKIVYPYWLKLPCCSLAQLIGEIYRNSQVCPLKLLLLSRALSLTLHRQQPEI